MMSPGNERGHRDPAGGGDSPEATPDSGFVAALRRPLGIGRRFLRRQWHRAVHPVRRRAAKRRLTSRGRPRAVLFVCYGNICRSPYAAVAFAQAVRDAGGDGVRIDSAGFVGPGRPPPEHAISVAADRGIDLSAHVSQQVTFELVRGADLVVVMDRRQERNLRRHFRVDERALLLLGDLDPIADSQRGIKDPFGRDRPEFVEAYTRIDRCLAPLAEVVFDHSPETGGTGP